MKRFFISMISTVLVVLLLVAGVHFGSQFFGGGNLADSITKLLDKISTLDYNNCTRCCKKMQEKPLASFSFYSIHIVKLYFFTFKKAPRLVKQVLTGFIHSLSQ